MPKYHKRLSRLNINRSLNDFCVLRMKNYGMSFERIAEVMGFNTIAPIKWVQLKYSIKGSRRLVR